MENALPCQLWQSREAGSCMGAFAMAQDRAECPLPGQANPPNKDRHRAEVENQPDALPLGLLSGLCAFDAIKWP